MADALIPRSPVAALAVRWGAIFFGSIVLWVAPISVKAPKLLIAISVPSAIAGFGWCAWTSSHWRQVAAAAAKRAILDEEVGNHHLALEENWLRQQLETYYYQRADGYGAESTEWGPFTIRPQGESVLVSAEPIPEPGSGSGSEPGSGSGSGTAEPTIYHRFSLPKDEAIALILQLLDAGLNQSQIIEELWGIKKGGSKQYKAAREQYLDLIK